MAKKAEKIYTVTSPIPNYNGIGAGGVQFAYGKAEVREGWVLEWYREHGYKVTLKQQSDSEAPSGETQSGA